MPKRLIKRWMPDQERLKEHKHLRLFGKLLLDANLWHLNRRSAAGAFAVGLFMAWIPLPCQMLLAAGGAIACRVNLPLSVALVWLSNPFTMPPLFYGAYLTGCQLLGQPSQHIDIEFTWAWLVSVFETLAPPLLLGSLVLALLSSLIGYALIRTFWRISTVRQWQKRKEARAC
ncbi:DUF2062 domain-containing protein [Aeromonas sp. MR19]|jgi:uncharacterized protein|uniref:DUF2062 domain-containing protein n=1 Tax=Aeromonas bestiarum TaxID=105751 RepID=A0AAP4JAV7_9GAMM|nr:MULTISPECIES: DUF2062 domain-containing protein [Aeromonas]ATM01289.1 DUF2062 domain-containing protein [Aeromonas sp. CA23]EKP0278965.1 DUF2062 domain-containing protein [Aeromonas bestiarum]KFN19404.1 flagellar biosynthesis protein FlhF [Aeromonas bestiarum]MCH7376528.1 DUF2062 domain-containing protein [Aeromonas sp. MR19]MDM5071195.1 DUF2062 domain-containing protein [Aeromonas bestiarum]